MAQAVKAVTLLVKNENESAPPLSPALPHHATLLKDGKTKKRPPDSVIVPTCGPRRFNTEAKKRNLKCRSCQMWFPTLTYLQHMQSVHKVQVLEREVVHTHLALTCAFCERHFLTLYKRDHHVKAHHNYIDTTCDFCFKNFSPTHSRKYHMRAHFVFDPNTKRTTKPIWRAKSKAIFRCPHCKNDFTSTFKLDVHVYTFHTRKNVPIQKKATSRDSKTLTSMTRDNQERMQPNCAFCGIAFSSLDKLVDHVLVRHLYGKRGKNVRSCDSCYACFEDKSALSEHILTANINSAKDLS